MRDEGLTHGGFYKHFASKDELLIESLSQAFREIEERLSHVALAEGSRPGTAWKAIVKTYLSPEHCAHPERGCPLAAVAPELARIMARTTARSDTAMKARILAELTKYQSRMLPFMPGRRAADKKRAFFAIFSTMMGAIAIARILPTLALREQVLASARDFLLRSF
jgi:TetR/AcrR family transcriptional repressor of nem operon